MTSLLSHLNPTPSFPPYTGPYTVGTVDIEIPVSELPSSTPSPNSLISTVSFRIFYPCEETQTSTRPVYWIPEPQHDYISAYARFLGASSKLSSFIAHFPQLIYYTTIPAIRDANLLSAPHSSERWPVLIFSHGLGGSRNAYSHLLGLLASYGMVAIAPEHRDGSAPTSFVKDHNSSKLVSIVYRSIPHDRTREVEGARDEQLKIRLWELGKIHEALLKIDRGERLSNIASDATAAGKGDEDLLHKFAASLDIHRPGSISWAGHSFGAATVVQFIKSVFYRPSQQLGDQCRPLYTPGEDSSIVQQITSSTTISLLDLWTLPLRSTFTRWLWDKPLPCYTTDGPGGSVVLAILSEAFFKWRGNLIQTKRAVSANPSGDRRNQLSKTPPYIFYPVKTAHLSQSDFGVLFPWTTKAIFKAEEPERTLKLNVLAMLELMRQNGSNVASATHGDKVAAQQSLQGPTNGHTLGSIFTKANGQGKNMPQSTEVESADEVNILAAGVSIRGWIAVDVEEETKPGEGENAKTSVEADPNEAVRETEVMGGAEIQEQKL